MSYKTSRVAAECVLPTKPVVGVAVECDLQKNQPPMVSPGPAPPAAACGGGSGGGGLDGSIATI